MADLLMVDSPSALVLLCSSHVSIEEGGMLRGGLRKMAICVSDWSCQLIVLFFY